MKQYFPFLLPGDSARRDVFPDFMSALAVTFMAVPQGVAYAVIAGLPPAMGLYMLHRFHALWAVSCAVLSM